MAKALALLAALLCGRPADAGRRARPQTLDLLSSPARAANATQHGLAVVGAGAAGANAKAANSTHVLAAAGAGAAGAAGAKAAPPCSCDASETSWAKCGQRKSRCVFIDLGAASGNTFNGFLSDKYGPLSGCTNGWSAILVEANPRFDAQLKHLEVAFPGLVEARTSTAAYSCEGQTSFYLDTVNHAQDYWGSSMSPTHPDVQHSGLQKVTVPTVNLNRLLVEETTPEDWVIVKMDIEGAEWDVLPCLANSPAAGLVDKLFVEEHSQQFSLTGTSRQQLDSALATLKAKGVDIPPYFSNTL